MTEIVHIIPSLQRDGSARQLVLLLKTIDRERHAPMVVCLGEDGPLAAELRALDVEVVCLDHKPSLRTVARLARILKRHQPRLVQTWRADADLVGWLAASMAKVRHVIWSVHGSDVDVNRPSRISAAVRRLLAKLSPRIEAIVANSDAGQAAHAAAGYSPKRWVRIDSGFEMPELSTAFTLRREIRYDLGFKDDNVVILLPAHLSPCKGHVVFLDAARILHLANAKVRFVLAGRGTDAPEIAAQIAEREIDQVTLTLGPRDDMERLYAMADIVSCTSLRGEGLPNVVGEAMAHEKAVVASAVGDTARLIGEAGRVVPPGEPNAFAQDWNDLIMSGPKGLKASGEAAREHILGHFPLLAMADRYSALYDDILSD